MNAFFSHPFRQLSAALRNDPSQGPEGPGRRTSLRGLAGAATVIVAATSLGGCGFALRQAPTFDFSTVFVTNNVNSPVSKALQRELASSGIQVGQGAPVAGVTDAVVLNVIRDQRERVVVGQTPNGQVRELELRYRFRYTLATPAGKWLIEEQEMMLLRDISFSETDALAKSAEEYLMFNDMQADVVQQVMRRLAAVKTR